MYTIITVIRIFFLPLKVLVNIVYPKGEYAGYAWYSKSEYRRITELDKSDPEELRTYEEWLEFAQTRVEEYKQSFPVVYKVQMKKTELLPWLAKENLENTSANRERYVHYRIERFLDDAII